MQHGRHHMVRANDDALAVITGLAQFLGQRLDRMVEFVGIVLAATLPGTQRGHDQKDQGKDDDEDGEHAAHALLQQCRAPDIQGQGRNSRQRQHPALFEVRDICRQHHAQQADGNDEQVVAQQRPGPLLARQRRFGSGFPESGAVADQSGNQPQAQGRKQGLEQIAQTFQMRGLGGDGHLLYGFGGCHAPVRSQPEAMGRKHQQAHQRSQPPAPGEDGRADLCHRHGGHEQGANEHGIAVFGQHAQTAEEADQNKIDGLRPLHLAQHGPP